jgi:hypothetical protein
MLLFVRKGCDFCKGLPKLAGLQVLEVSQTPRGPQMMVEGMMVPVPAHVKGLPALLIGHELIMGKNFVKDRINKLAAEPPAGGT